MIPESEAKTIKNLWMHGHRGAAILLLLGFVIGSLFIWMVTNLSDLPTIVIAATATPSP